MESTKLPSAPVQEIFAALQEQEHEQVMFVQDKALGLKGIIAIHNTTLGPAMGGLRMWNYASEAEALTDVLRLSRGMTLKNALAGINIGGGKAVIMGDARVQKSEALLRRMGKFVHNLGGKYYTAEDVGMSEQDMMYIRSETPYVTGLPREMGGSGDPSPVTAYGVYVGMKAAWKYRTGTDSLEGVRVMVQGVGSVGSHLVDYLAQENASIFMYDVYEASLKEVAGRTGATVVDADEVYSLPVDIYAPCALGATLNPDTIPSLTCSVIAGAANNQLLDEERDGQALKDRDILYAPDFMVNCGGIINVSLELGTYSREMAMKMTERVYQTTLEICTLAKDENITTHAAAWRAANNRIQQIGRNRLFL
ncbi:MAG: Glu/Leu/Phe/Val dehydrogenase [Bacteroidota bacterium]